MQQKLLKLQQSLSQSLIGRDEAVKSALLALIAKENVLLIGPPGTAKSMLARRISQALTPSDHAYFEYLLTKFSTPEEIFGPLSISELKQDRFKRNTDGYLPTVQVAFLDEIFKASSSILNALLTILNERKYHNGTASTDVPLLSLIAASNELPTGQAELSALYDRFLIRRFVDYVDQDELAKFFDVMPHAVAPTYLSPDDINAIHQKAQTVTFPDDVKQAIQQIWAAHADAFKENADERLSDRRFVKVLNLMRISAVTNDRAEVDFSDVLLLKDCLWDNPENRDKVQEIIRTVLQKFDKQISVDTDKEITPITPITTATVSQNVIKGMQGSGTKDDPILIETVQHLKRLEDPNIGQQGYYFKQTQDIDCSNITKNSWFNITFIGYYDGNGKNISHKNQMNLFKNISNSQIKDLNLSKLSLSKNATHSTFIKCTTDRVFISRLDDCEILEIQAQYISNKINDSTIEYCKASYISNQINDSTIEYCKASLGIAKDEAYNLKISNCQILITDIFDIKNSRNYTISGISNQLSNSFVEKIFISGTIKSNLDLSYSNTNFYGIANKASKTHISKCAVGIIDTSFNTHLLGIDCEIAEDCHFDNNVSLKNNALGNFNLLSKVLFTQDYFEYTLDWDFDTIWQWNNDRNEPELRPDIYTSDEFIPTATPNQANTSSQLTQQLKANIWL